MSYRANLSHDGYIYTKQGGLAQGLRTYGVILPETKIRDAAAGKVWDVIVVGAGYTGLIAARDLVKAGKKTLLLEARDRIGGRTWSAEVDGTTYEMGGTWVSHVHGRLFTEMQRYGLQDAVQMTRTDDGGCAYFTLDTGSGSRKLSLEEAGAMTQRAWKLFMNIDGLDGRLLCPLPYSSLGNQRVSFEQIQAVDQISCRDRIDQIKDELSADELALLESLVPHMCAGTVEDVGYLEMLRAQALQGFTPETFEEVWTLYKIREGQSALARKIFDDAVRLGLQYSFRTPIKSIIDRHGVVTLDTTTNKTFRARRVVNTIPLSVLHTIHFDPPLSPLRQEAMRIGHLNHLTKVHAEVEGDLRGLRGCTWPGDLLYIYGDGFCAGEKSTRITSFAGDNRGKLDPLKEPERLETALQRFHPMKIKKMLFHDWLSDPYSQAGPAWYRTGFLTKYLAELQKRHGNVLMANADWAMGWRAFIEGAMEQGGLAADTVMNELGIQGANPASDPERDARL
ncbi:Putative Monoamine oxidase N [Aspergillus calidoustus]|uniref:monoamine oxidase n=1 Tax=Aspergillus calidoustus TaxID=454130 RepID=A0A0U5FMC9_ASPCI|nr:Putative Monoamine oxidase N [Aspergillus calidoustus]